MLEKIWGDEADRFEKGFAACPCKPKMFPEAKTKSAEDRHPDRLFNGAFDRSLAFKRAA